VSTSDTMKSRVSPFEHRLFVLMNVIISECLRAQYWCSWF